MNESTDQEFSMAHNRVQLQPDTPYLTERSTQRRYTVKVGVGGGGISAIIRHIAAQKDHTLDKKKKKERKKERKKEKEKNGP